MTDNKAVDYTNYIKIVEKLIYLIIYTRPNILFILEKLAQFINNFVE